jgi:putative methyltransferase
MVPSADGAQPAVSVQDPFPGWHRRGLPLWPGCDKLLRVDPLNDGTEGFFVAVLERGGGGGGGDAGGGSSEAQQPKQQRQQQQQQKKLAKIKKRPM